MVLKPTTDVFLGLVWWVSFLNLTSCHRVMYLVCCYYGKLTVLILTVKWMLLPVLLYLPTYTAVQNKGIIVTHYITKQC